MAIWLQWEAQFKRAKEPNLEKARKRLMNQIQGKNIQKECNTMASILNQIIHSNDFDNFSNQLLQKIIQSSNIDTNSLGDINFKTNRGKSAGFALKSSEASAKWAQFYSLSNSMSKEQQRMMLADPNSQLSQIKLEAQRLSGKLTSLKGQILESFLYAIGAAVEAEAIDMAENRATEIVVDLIKTKLPNILISGGEDLIKTQGSKSSSINITIGDTFIKKISSQGKVDTEVPSPFLDGTKWFASAKNYSSLRDIELLGKGSIIGLISQGFNSKESKYIYNAFTIPESNWTSVNMHQLKQIFAIQALIGQKADEVKANVLVLSINNNKNPIRVISTYALLDKIFNDTKMSHTAFKFNPQLESLLPTGDSSARQQQPNNILNNMVISISLNRSAVTAKYISQLG